MFLSKQVPSSPLLASLLDLYVVQTQIVPAEDTLMLKSYLVFNTRYSEYCIIMCLILKICVIYIILVDLSY